MSVDAIEITVVEIFAGSHRRRVLTHTTASTCGDFGSRRKHVQPTSTGAEDSGNLEEKEDRLFDLLAMRREIDRGTSSLTGKLGSASVTMKNASRCSKSSPDATNAESDVQLSRNGRAQDVLRTREGRSKSLLKTTRTAVMESLRDGPPHLARLVCNPRLDGKRYQVCFDLRKRRAPYLQCLPKMRICERLASPGGFEPPLAT